MPNFEQNQVIAVGLSGGVDSSVAALVLKEKGYEVIGLFMQNWETDSKDPFCTAEQDLSDAKAIADHIGIPLYVVNFSKAYWNHVFQHCLDEFAQGRTPNPDVWCNREIKFKSLLDHAKKLGATHLATGHYACIQNENNEYRLLKSNDSHKDQSYFLHLLNQYQLANSVFPIGGYQKSEVRAIAKKEDSLTMLKKTARGSVSSANANLKTSSMNSYSPNREISKHPRGKLSANTTELCFIPLVNAKGFISAVDQTRVKLPGMSLTKM